MDTVPGMYTGMEEGSLAPDGVLGWARGLEVDGRSAAEEMSAALARVTVRSELMRLWEQHCSTSQLGGS